MRPRNCGNAWYVWISKSCEIDAENPSFCATQRVLTPIPTQAVGPRPGARLHDIIVG